MKPSNTILFGLKGLFSLKRLWLIGILYSIFIIYCLLILAREGHWSHLGIYDLMANLSGITGSTNQNMFILLAIPFIVTMTTQLMNKNEKGLHVLKAKSRFQIWHTHVISVVCFSFILTCLILIISFLVGGLLVGMENTWASSTGSISETLENNELFLSITSNLATYKIIGTIFLTKFLGFMMISFLALFLRQFIKSGSLIVIILITLAGIDLFGLLPTPIFTGAASLDMSDWVNPMITIYQSIYLFIITLILYGVTGLLYERKDFLS